ncbi:uncharacterized protein LOC141619286 [Silene latifolia]|uniref:uncharacterized protein LOC141619286 n=1 Tax=Silene latifolia TaxID=37657 RepID=UPI003D783776
MSASQMTLIILLSLSLSWFSVFGSPASQPRQEINQYFRFDEQSDSWVPVELPYNLVTCVNDNCTIVGSIREVEEKRVDGTEAIGDVNNGKKEKQNYKRLLPVRKRISLTKMSETSLWITGESGSIYERFWNGVHWVIAPHDLPSSIGPAISVFMVNQTILALSEGGLIYQMQLTENSQLFWRDFAVTVGHNEVTEQKQIQVKSGFVTNDGERIYFCTRNGSLLELVENDPPRLENHGHPPGADVAAIADAGTIRQNLVFTISSAGELYEHDKNTKPPWKKHLRKEGLPEDTYLIPSKGCIAQGLSGASSISLFLITKAGKLIERKLYRRKWKWILHGSSEDQLLTSITPVSMEEPGEKYSLFLTTSAGSILEYQMTKETGVSQEKPIGEAWVNHLHPPHAKIARGIPGKSYQFGRLFFPLDDGRLAELHLSGYGGENSGPIHQVNIRKKGLLKYVWSVHDVPESEGWNAEYCTEQRGPFNCMMGVKDEATDLTTSRTVTRRQKGLSYNYLIPDSSSLNLGRMENEHKLSEKLVNSNFRMRVMQGGRSMFLVTNSGLSFEFLYNNDVGVWLRHEHSTPMNGAVGSYNGSLFFIDIHGSLLSRERSNNELQWINCTAMNKGSQIISGPPWDIKKITASDALYFVSKNGRLLQFTVAQKNFKWRDCKNPGNTKVASIVDQKVLREKVVFVTGRNGKLYQYNTLYKQWHEHYQSHHLILSRLPGTATRRSTLSLKGSLFMISEDGGLVEYHWNSVEGWMWVEHGTPHETVRFIGAPGPSYEGQQLFLVGSNGKAYLRYLDCGEWKWRDWGYPDTENASVDQDRQNDSKHQKRGIGVNTGDSDDTDDLKLSKNNRICNPKLSSTRPVPSAEDKVIFELRDGRLAEMYRVKDFDWIWSKIIATPTSKCSANFWATGVS